MRSARSRRTATKLTVPKGRKWPKLLVQNGAGKLPVEVGAMKDMWGVAQTDGSTFA